MKPILQSNIMVWYLHICLKSQQNVKKKKNNEAINLSQKTRYK